MPNSNLTIFNNKRLSCSELLKSLLIANKEPINRDIKASLLLLKGLFTENDKFTWHNSAIFLTLQSP